MAPANHERDYVLGTHDEEIARLGLQHRVWRPRALDAWRRAGFTTGQTLLDVGCGPGFASFDLAEIAGAGGRVLAFDRSRRFLDALEAEGRRRGLGNISTREIDLAEEELPRVGADGAWCRWVFAFVKQPRALLARIGAALRPGGALVVHEYLDYVTWRFLPRCPEHEEFVRVVMESWRAEGGEPDIGRDLPGWMAELGFEVRELRPILDIVPPSSFVWQWPKAFLRSGLRRLVDLGTVAPGRGEEMARAFEAAEAAPRALMTTPLVLEILATRR